LAQNILYGEGISREGEIIDQAVNLDLIEKAGSWYSYNGEKIGQGKDNVREYLKQNSDIAQEIEQKILAKANIINAEMVTPEDTAEVNTAED
jgi:recombination protein RecA